MGKSERDAIEKFERAVVDACDDRAGAEASYPAV